MNKDYVTRGFCTLDTYLPVELFIKRLQESCEIAKAAGYIDLRVELCQNEYDDGYHLLLSGMRPKTPEEIKEELKDKKRIEEYEFKQYQQLKKRFEK